MLGRLSGFSRLSAQISLDTLNRPRMLVCFVLIIGYFLLSNYAYWGGWDAPWWNLKALFIAQSDPLLAFRLDYLPHLSYPPLLPLVVGVAWRIFGVSQAIVIVLHSFVWVSVLAALWRLPFWAFLIAAVALFPASTNQMGDLPLTLALMWAWITYRRFGDHPLPGVMLGIAILIKNEGAMFAAIFLVIALIEQRRLPVRLLLGLAPGIVTLIFFKTVIAPTPTDLFEDGNSLSRLLDTSRYPYIVREVLLRVFSWGYFAFPIAVVCAWADKRRIDIAAFAIFLLGILGYMAIFALTPSDVRVHIATSIPRLIMHTFPFFMFAMSMRPYKPVMTY